MNDKPARLPLLNAAVLAATFFGVGYAKWAPGTVASLLTVPLAWAILRWADPLVLGAIALLVFALGIWASGVYVRRTGRDDASEIVIDEVAGQMLTLILARPEQWWHFALGFVLFRIFDIFKPWPVSLADRRVAGGFGVMLDDLLAALYGCASFYVIVRILEAGYFQ